MKKGKRKTPRTRVYFSAQELGAMAFLQQFPDFQTAKPNEILKACLMIVAIDTKVKLEEQEAAKEKEQAQEPKEEAADNE